MSTRERRFVWDNDKALANKRKHGITFELAATVFKDPLREAFHDWNHVDFEERWVVIGVAENGLLLLVSCAATDLEEGIPCGLFPPAERLRMKDGNMRAAIIVYGSPK